MNPSALRVAILREPARAGELKHMLIERGYLVTVHPVTRIEYIEHPKDQEWAAMILACQGVVFTSLNGVEALARGLGGLERLAALLRKRVVAGMGRKCWGRLTSAGVDVCFAATKGGSEALARRLAGRLPPASKVLYPGAEKVLLRLGEQLQEFGHSMDRLVCYRTVKIPLEERGSIDWANLDLAVLAAPSAVGAVVEDPSLPRDFSFVAIGPTTAAALRERGLRAASVAATPDSAGMFTAICEVRSGRRGAEVMEGN